MDRAQIKKYLDEYRPRQERTVVIVDFGNVEKWRHTLGWTVGIRELATFIKNLSRGALYLRRFYYGADYGSSEKSTILTEWSKHMLQTARWNGFEVIDKRVKYIHTPENIHGFEKKCDLDVEMAIDLIQERDNYDSVVLISGDGDLMRAVKYLKEYYSKRCIVMSARGHLGREVIDAKSTGIVEEILFADDFEYRLNMRRHWKP